MFSFFKTKTQKPTGETLQLTLSGLHCTSCSLTIDTELEDLPGVISVQTSYAKSKTKVTFDPNKVTPLQIKQVITNMGYSVSKMD